MNDVAREEKTVDEGFLNTLEDSSTEEKGLGTKHIKWNKHLLIKNNHLIEAGLNQSRYW